MQLCKIAPKTLIPNEACRFQEICLRVLSLCKSNSRKDGVCVHSPIIKLGLHYDMYLSNNLLNLYGKCFGVEHARHFFDEMPQRDVVSWTSILSAYVKSGHHYEALEIFGTMLNSGQFPNEFTLSSALRSCSALGEFEYGAQIHASMVKLGLELNPYVKTTLINLYTRCDYSVEAYKLLSSIEDGDAISWTTMISSLAESQKWSEALQLYIQMIEASVYPNEFTFVKLLGASCFIGLNYGKLLHAHTFIFGIKMNVILKTALVNMYSKFRQIEDAIKAAKLTPEHDVFLWTTIVSGFAKSLRVREAVNAFVDMETCGILPNNFTFASLLNACSSVLSLHLGEQFHSQIIMAGLEDDVYVGNALVDMYSKCSPITKNAMKAFREISSPNVISWTSLIAGIAEHGYEEDAFHLYMEMRAAGEIPNSITLSCILRACSNIKSIGQTMKFHAHIIKTNADNDIIVGNALVNTYSGQGMIAEAWSVIGSMNCRDPVTYTSLVARINQRQDHALALNFITHMCHDNIKIDEFSLASFLSAAASLGSMETGKQLHCYSVKSGLESYISVSNSLVHLYSKCGNIHDAYRAFIKINEPAVVSWNAIISGLASNGHISNALSAFDDMKLAGVEPDSVTFSSLLFACSHGGLFDLGLAYFQAMEKTYHITPNLDNYVCLVDLLGRAGRLEEAMGVIETMPFRADSIIYKALLNASKLYGNVPLGEDMARRCLQLDPSDPAIYLLLANLYDNAGYTDLGDKTRRLMRDRGLRKSSSQCWIEISGKIYHFSAGESSYRQMDKIDERLKLLEAEFRNRGYPYRECRDKFHHPERLAVAFGLLRGPPMAPIRINKNLHICSDCHNFIMFVTLVVDRDIIVRDGNKIHLFQKGHCSCRGQW
ncbi:pentatricopeptide repeat-containing protein At5g52850, chloroplastic [Neltuma alba]|uniref:pentatricopeptide repeat-containing protein At5g52850, chloroplastic n=1 Tax=Neltuma alba TaxID=207710 RepID=UPI0010A3EF29|nr:pentatricopeptide repeat-containing protein At5g52850, chloroplastic [Prosopis alba]XP_028785467.1 pentatricopeptide repeat-containing protein At5g52850, chloroplastic [Prosopis alba]